LTKDDKPTKFDLNEEFAHQEKIDLLVKESESEDSESDSNNNRSDDFKPTDLNKIPDDTHFFFILTRSTLFALNHFTNSIAKTYRSIQIEWLEEIKVDAFHPDVLKGGLEDIGNFKEGFCFRLNSRTEVIWNICADT